MQTAAAPLLHVEHLTMRFGGLVAIDDLSFTAARGDITAIIGPNGAGKTTVFNCITGFYKPSCGRMLLSHGEALAAADIEALTASGARSRDAADRRGLPARAHARLRDRRPRPRRPHLPEHPPVRRHDGAGEPDRCPAQPADGCLGLDDRRPARPAQLPGRRGQGRRARALLARQDRPDRARRRSGRRPALRRAAAARDRARHVQRSGPAVPGRAGGRPQPARSRPT